MYHYVRDLKLTKYKNLKALKLDDFKKQILFLKKNYKFYNPISYDKKMNFNNHCWLTFDDGYLDHFKFVLPILEENNIKGSFFITNNIQKQTILEVNKIQFLLECKKSKNLLNEIKILHNKLLKLKKNSFINFIISKIKIDHRYDDVTTVIVKRLLQRELPASIRNKIIEILFKKYVTKNEKKFHRELYLNINQLKIMKKLGHEIGNHSLNHYWLSKLSKSDQHDEINENLKFLRKYKLIKNKWTMCYPYGDYNFDTLKILKKLKCSRALSTTVGSVNKRSKILELPRLNTNDFFPIS